MSGLTGKPGSSCSPVMAPANQNGMERAKTDKKNFIESRCAPTPKQNGTRATHADAVSSQWLWAMPFSSSSRSSARRK